VTDTRHVNPIFNLKPISLLIAAALLFSSCKKMLDRAVHTTGPVLIDGYQEYIIPSGEHYTSTNTYKAVSNKKEMHFMAWLDSSCIYRSLDPSNQGDINKLYGFADCGAEHQSSSARFGWNWNGNAFEIYAYCYVNGIRESKLMGSLRPKEKAEMSIVVSPRKYVFRFKDKIESMERTCSSEAIEGYQLYPYFGGDEPAPHVMKMYIKEL
jgi:hypothetical protein